MMRETVGPGCRDAMHRVCTIREAYAACVLKMGVETHYSASVRIMRCVNYEFKNALPFFIPIPPTVIIISFAVCR